MKKIALFGGTFDPIHFGHIALAIQMLEAHRLDEVLFCPTFRSPFKGAEPPKASPFDRIAMCLLALEDLPAFQLCRLELEREGISYTVDTLRELHALYGKSAEWHLILSEDCLSSFHQWKEPDEVLRLARPLVGVRGVRRAIPPSHLAASLAEGLTETARMDISSTMIRERLKKNLYCGHLIPAKSLDYIKKERLYLAL